MNINTCAYVQELIFEGFASSLGRYFFPPAREGEPEGWALLDAEHQRWHRLRASIRDQAVSEHALIRQVRGGEEGEVGGGQRGRGDLPQGLMTAICVKFRMVPGPATAELRGRSCQLHCVALDVQVECCREGERGREGILACIRARIDRYIDHADIQICRIIRHRLQEAEREGRVAAAWDAAQQDAEMASECGGNGTKGGGELSAGGFYCCLRQHAAV